MGKCEGTLRKILIIIQLVYLMFKVKEVWSVFDTEASRKYVIILTLYLVRVSSFELWREIRDATYVCLLDFPTKEHQGQ